MTVAEVWSGKRQTIPPVLTLLPSLHAFSPDSPCSGQKSSGNFLGASKSASHDQPFPGKGDHVLYSFRAGWHSPEKQRAHFRAMARAKRGAWSPSEFFAQGPDHPTVVHVDQNAQICGTGSRSGSERNNAGCTAAALPPPPGADEQFHSRIRTRSCWRRRMCRDRNEKTECLPRLMRRKRAMRRLW